MMVELHGGSDDENNNENLYSVRLQIFKQFTTQQNRNARRLDEITIEFRTLDDFKTNLWNALSDYCKPAADIIDDEPTISENAPTQNECDKYFGFKRNNCYFCVSALTPTILHGMAYGNEAVITSLFQYCDTIGSKEQLLKFHATILQPAVQDRSGAAANTVIADICTQLRQQHSTRFSAESALWMIWATYIASHHVPMHQRMIESPPPSHLIHLFRSVPSTHAVQLESVNQSMQVSHNIIQSVTSIVEQIRDEASTLTHSANALIVRLDGLQTMLHNYTTVIAGIETATRPDASTGQPFEDEITPADDTDHAQN